MHYLFNNIEDFANALSVWGEISKFGSSIGTMSSQSNESIFEESTFTTIDYLESMLESIVDSNKTTPTMVSNWETL